MKLLTINQREQMIKKIIDTAKLNILGDISARQDPLVSDFCAFILKVDDLSVSDITQLEEDTYTEAAAIEFAKYMTQRMLAFKCQNVKVAP